MVLKSLITLVSLIAICKTAWSNESNNDYFKKLREKDPFIQNLKTKPVKKKINKIQTDTVMFFLRKGTKVIKDKKVFVLPKNIKVKVLYNPSFALNDVIDQNGAIRFKVKTIDLISVQKASNIQVGTLFKAESLEVLNDKKIPKTKFLFRFGYGGSFFEDSFNNQFLTQANDKIYAGCLDLHLEGLIASSNQFIFGGTLNLTTGQYTSLESGPIFQNFSLGPLLKVKTFKNTYIGAGVTYSIAHDITVQSAINIQNIFLEKFVVLEYLSEKDLSNWAFGVRLKSIDHKVRFQDDLNTFKNTQSSLSIGAYVSKGFNFFSF